jgi:hypothetical protein
MFFRKLFIVGAVLIYVVLLVCFFKLRQGKNEFDPTCYDELCLRFCCKEQACDQKFIDENFDFSSFPAGKAERIHDMKFRGFFGKPNCDLKRLSDDEPWEFYYVSSRDLSEPLNILKLSKSFRLAASTTMTPSSLKHDIALRMTWMGIKSNGVYISVKATKTPTKLCISFVSLHDVFLRFLSAVFFQFSQFRFFCYQRHFSCLHQ